MPGTAIVVINESEWSVDVANTSAELIQGLSGLASILSGTGMLFILPARQLVTVDTSLMLFPIDIIFIKDNAVLSVARNISPEYLVEEATPCDMFLEVNANEAVDIEVGDEIVITDYTIPAAFDFSTIISFAIPLALLGFVGVLVSGMMGGGGSSSRKRLESSSSSIKVGDKVRVIDTDVEGEVRMILTATTVEVMTSEGIPMILTISEIEKIGKQLKSGSNPKPTKKVTVTCPICKEEILVKEYNRVTRSETLRKHLEEKHGHQSSGTEYYWEITDIETGEIIQRSKPYTSVSKVYRSARDYQRRRPGKEKEHLVVIRIYDTPVMEEWGKTIKYVLESGMHRGIPILIGKTPLQEAALDRLWPYKVLEIHSDGDLTIISAGKKYVVTTEGGVFGEEDVIPAGGHMIEIPLGKEPPKRLEVLKEILATKTVDEAIALRGKYRDVWLAPDDVAAIDRHLSSLREKEHFSAKYPEHVKTASKITDFVAEASINMWEVSDDVDRASANMELIPGKTFTILEHTKMKIQQIAMATRGLPHAEDIQDEYMPRVTTLLSRIDFAMKRVNDFITQGNEDEASNWSFAVRGYTQELAKLQDHAIIDTYERLSGEKHQSISGEPRRRLVEEHGSWAVGRAEAICPEGDVACVEREAKRLIETLRTRYGEVPTRYVTITDAGATVFRVGDTVSIVALERENKRVRELGEKEATHRA